MVAFPTDQLSSCLKEEFRCGSGLCIPIAWQCDGEKDCPEADALDEWDLLCSKWLYFYRCFSLLENLSQERRGAGMMSFDVRPREPVYLMGGGVTGIMIVPMGQMKLLAVS